MLKALDVTSSDTHGSPKGTFYGSHVADEETEAQMIEVTITPRCALPNKANVKAP